MTRHLARKVSEFIAKLWLVERLKLNARELLKRNDMFKNEIQCSVDIEDHRFQ